MAFYEDLSVYYDYVFPTGKEQLEFIREIAGNPPKDVLDIACGTGGYSIALVEEGYRVTAADIDAAMIEKLKAKMKGKNSEVVCVTAGMLDMAGKISGRFDTGFCIGNSVVHLDNKSEILSFLKTAKELLNEGGHLIIQIINFDRILLKDIKSLPAIENNDIGLRFERYYRFDEGLNKVFFRTVLSVDDKRIENEIPLYPLQSGEAVCLLKEAGFDRVELYGDFRYTEYDNLNSYMLVILAS